MREAEKQVYDLVVDPGPTEVDRAFAEQEALAGV
jgi:hypothetical protein